MIIVGVGVGPGMLTQEGIEAIRSAPAVYGSGRALEIARPYITTDKVEALRDFKNLHLLPEKAVILSTGDPMFSGLGKFAGENDIVIPGISSFQVTCARLHQDLTAVSFITAHGRKDPEKAEREFLSDIERGKNIFLLPDDAFGAKEVCALLKERSIPADVYSVEELGYPEERIDKGNPDRPPEHISELYSLFIVLKQKE